MKGLRLGRAAGILLLAAGLAVWLWFRPDRALRVATGVVAHDLCSKTFISGLDPEMVMAETVTRSGIRRFKWVLRYRVNRDARSVAASLGGLLTSRAIHREGLGCVMQHQTAATPVDLKGISRSGQPLLIEIAGPQVVEPEEPALTAALDNAFAEPSEPPLRRTKAVVVVKDGRIIAERYAQGIGIDTPLMGFSMTKSVVNALVGILVRDGYLTLQQAAPIAEWRGAGDQRAGITIEHLMRMTSGLAADETNSGFDVSSRILYHEDDMGKAAAKPALIAQPGTRWHYSSPSTLLLSRIISETIGSGSGALLEFAHTRLFKPLGMSNVTLESDAKGMPIGSTYMFASARDWARFGLLYLNDGKIGETRILPEGWVDYSASSSLGTYYGAGFWTVRSPHPWAQAWIAGGMPKDAFFASGDLGQRLVVLPSQRLVIVRLGDAVDPTGDMQGLLRLMREVVAVVRQ
jgi:CubicO group peptidase (beta-lactamase class C family)